MLDGRESAFLPVPADARAAQLMTTSLGVGEDIDDDVAVVVSTSGTTGVPKGALLTAPALIASASATHDRLGGPGTWLLALPAYHVAGLQVLVRSILAGTVPVAIDPSFDVDELPAAIDALGSGPRYASLVAVQLVKALADPAATAALAELDAVLIGGGPMPATVGEARCRGRHSGGAHLRHAARPPAAACTTACRSTASRCASTTAASCSAGTPWPRATATPSTPDPFAEAGWFRTDDVGASDDSGVLRVLGRIDDAIGTGGLTVLPQLVEAALATHPAVADCAVFGVTDERLGQRVAAAVVSRSGRDAPTVAELRAHVEQTLDATAAPREVHVVDELPRRGIGKLDRRELAARFDAGA